MLIKKFVSFDARNKNLSCSKAERRRLWCLVSLTKFGRSVQAANDPDPQMIPGPEMIPKLDRRWSQDQKWSPNWTANDPRDIIVSKFQSRTRTRSRTRSQIWRSLMSRRKVWEKVVFCCWFLSCWSPTLVIELLSFEIWGLFFSLNVFIKSLK